LIKDDGSPVTSLDLEIERLFSSRIAADFPEDGVLGEELGGSRSEHGWTWIVDPIDGTANFIEGLPAYAHMVACQLQGETVFSLISAPMLERRWWAYRGLGAFRGGVPVGVSGTADLSAAKIAYGGLRDYAVRTPDVVRLITSCARSRAPGNFLSHVLVADGTYDLASSADGCSPWDVVPLRLLVSEAGGRLTDLDGGEWSAPGAVLSSNGLLHQAALSILRESATVQKS
jgi:histidinol-phosphatase